MSFRRHPCYPTPDRQPTTQEFPKPQHPKPKGGLSNLVGIGSCIAILVGAEALHVELSLGLGEPPCLVKSLGFRVKASDPPKARFMSSSCAPRTLRYSLSQRPSSCTVHDALGASDLLGAGPRGNVGLWGRVWDRSVGPPHHVFLFGTSEGRALDGEATKNPQPPARSPFLFIF